MNNFEVKNKESNYISLSGRYEGNMLFPIGGKTSLELRIDIDKICDNSPVLNKISGSFYQNFSSTNIDKDLISNSLSQNIYLESWIVDNPIIKSLSASYFEIIGTVRYWKKNKAPKSDIKIIVYRFSQNTIEQAEVTFTDTVGNITKYMCVKKSHYLRDIELDVQVVKSLNTEPILPLYDTNWSINRPPDLSRRILTVEECYREAGINLATIYRGNIIDNVPASFVYWDDAELYDAMETYYNDQSLSAWKIWCFICGNYIRNNVFSMMFDADIRFANVSNDSETDKFIDKDIKPQRLGFVIFKNNFFIDKLTSESTVKKEEQICPMRRYLCSFVHEVGHVFNLVHSWNKDNPSSLSWMNYPGNYPYGPNDTRNSEDEYWNNFRFRFDIEELTHMRHGDRVSVLMGGDPVYTSMKQNIITPDHFPLIWENGSPIEFLLRSQDYFEFMEPIEIELRLKNLLNYKINIDILFNPEFGRITVFIQDPYGNIKKYLPIIIKESTPVLMPLLPSREKDQEKTDRYSENIVITYGKDGFYFKHPGDYLIQAIYHDFQNIIIPSNVLRLRIKPPMSKKQENMAFDFFTHQVGMNLYLKGSQSPFLTEGKQKLKKIFNPKLQSSLQAKIALVLASAETKPFFKITNEKIYQIHKPNPEEALKLSEPAKNFYKRAKKKSFNIAHRNVVRVRYNALRMMNRPKEAEEQAFEFVDTLIGKDRKDISIITQPTLFGSKRANR